jgi:hypothetical protein
MRSSYEGAGYNLKWAIYNETMAMCSLSMASTFCASMAAVVLSYPLAFIPTAHRDCIAYLPKSAGAPDWDWIDF